MSESFGDSPRHDAVITVDRYGNTASTTHTVALVEELEAGRIKAGERIALLALALTGCENRADGPAATASPWEISWTCRWPRCAGWWLWWWQGVEVPVVLVVVD